MHKADIHARFFPPTPEEAELSREYVPQHYPLWVLPDWGDPRSIVADTDEELHRAIARRVLEATAKVRPVLVVGWLRGLGAAGRNEPVETLQLRPVTVDGSVWGVGVRLFFGVTSDMAIGALRDDLRRSAILRKRASGAPGVAPPVSSGLAQAGAAESGYLLLTEDRPRVFVSYVHENARHMARVLDFVNFLRDPSGIDADCDRYHEGPRQVWPSWVRARIEGSDFVVIIASPSMRWALDRMVNGRYRGVRDELSHLENLQKRDPSTWISKILPVVLPGCSADDIPAFLDPHTADHYLIEALTESGAARLLDTIRGIRRTPAPPCCLRVP